MMTSGDKERAEAVAADSARLEAVGLVRRFGRVSALSGLSFSVEPKMIYGLVGPDGAGKTTALRILAGVMGADSGTATVNGKAPLSADPSVRSLIGYMPQQYSLYGDLSVEENLRFFSRMFCLSKADFRERRDRLLEITRLGRFTERRADALSGGMYKKLALACSLLPRPQFLILDEPTNGVDPVSRRELWTLLFELANEGMGVLVSTAYMDEAARCHRVGLLHQGRMLVEGDPRDLLRHFEHPVFRIVSQDLSRFEALIRDRSEVLASSFSATELRIVVREGQAAPLLERLEQGGGKLERVPPVFEEVFLAHSSSTSSSFFSPEEAQP